MVKSAVAAAVKSAAVAAAAAMVAKSEAAVVACQVAGVMKASRSSTVKDDTATFGESRVYWAFVINAISRVGTGLVPGSTSTSSASSGDVHRHGPSSAAEDMRTGGPEEEIEEEDEADEEAQLQLLNYNPGRDRMLEDSLDDREAYDDNGENKFMA